MDTLKEKGIKTQIIKKTKYVYIDKPYWDKNKKQNRHKREYIGKLSDDGEFIPNKKYIDRQKNEKDEKKEEKALIASRKFFGGTHLLDCIGEKVGIQKDLKEAFGEETSKKIMSLSYFMVLESESSMYRFPKFAKTHKHPNGELITSQKISDIFSGISENEKALFFKNRTKRCLKNEYLAYDTTSISSYSETMEQIKYGHNKDLESLPQLNLAMVFGEGSMLPVYYRKMPGNISDVSTMKKLLIDMDFLGLKKVNFVLDRGFYSADNLNSLYRNRHKFVISGRTNAALVQSYIKEMYEKIKDFQNYNIVHDIYCLTKESRWKYEYRNKKGEKSSENRLLYIHGYYDGTRAEQEKKNFIKKLKLVEESFLATSSSDTQKMLLDKYFILGENKGEVSITPNQEAINAHMQNFGYFVLLSNHISDGNTAISIYRNKDVVEKTFCNLKNRLDMKRTKVSSEESLEGKLFIQFVALIYISYIHKIMLKNTLYKNYSMASLLDEIDIIEIFDYSGKKIHFSEITKKQRDILHCFDITLPNTTL